MVFSPSEKDMHPGAIQHKEGAILQIHERTRSSTFGELNTFIMQGGRSRPHQICRVALGKNYCEGGEYEREFKRMLEE
ncbi:hypothetical protein AMTR_s00181p00052490 [Amborella trichopoda]|uniref:Uncharacterized protein n=1 Tax=Amborella trichopoda TaxID=13333 RepID=W1P7U2_AMBTC|nr:hypothetical protein AMTR_s00181p00052490 [Amborella trichopoda]